MEELDELDESEAAKEYNNQPVATIKKVVNEDGTLRNLVRARKSIFVHNLLHLNGAKFDLSGRDYILPVYDSPDKNIILKTGRQVEKCQLAASKVHLATGEEIEIRTVVSGHRVVALGPGGHQTTDVVVASESNGDKPCLRIKTRLGSTLEVTYNHPLRELLGWSDASSVVVGDKIAALRTVGQFGTTHEPLAALIGLLFGDGCFSSDGSIRQKAIGFTCKSQNVQDWFEMLVMAMGHKRPRFSIAKCSGSRQYRVQHTSSVGQWLDRHGLFGSLAASKKLPDEVFGYDEASTRDLLRGLWTTDGHCKNVTRSKVDLVYCSVSEVLARQVRLLLRKFGVVTVMRTYKPKKGQLAHIVRVVTRRSIEAFYSKVGPVPGKLFVVPNTISNSNLDTLPREIHGVITVARKKAGHYWQRNGLQSAGLYQKTIYCPTYEKVAELQKHVYDDVVQWALDADIIWDKIISIEDIGTQPTWAIQTKTETYVSDFLVNHNSSFLANNLVISSVVVPYQKNLYVSPSHTQTRQFSSEKLKPLLEQSPLIQKYLQSSSCSAMVFEKGFTNGSFIFLRSAFRSADRTRGISVSGCLTLDELQDFVTSEIPVILECTSHYPNSEVLMAGTPKSHDNTIEIYWQSSTQNEWLVKCTGCNHYNFLDETNIAPTTVYLDKTFPPGPICKKCQKPIDATTGRWFTFSPGKNIKGYRISQLMVPWIIGLDNQWQKLLWKRDNYPAGQFQNEVLGISHDNASKPITRDELIGCCDAEQEFYRDPPNAYNINHARSQLLIGGVDWGSGLDGADKSPSGKIRHASYTVLTLGYYEDQKHFRVAFIKKYTGAQSDPHFVIQDIVRICMQLNVHLLGVDWGFGFGLNNELVRQLSFKRVVQFQYLPKMKERAKYDPIGAKYLLQRNLIISELFYELKHGHIRFPAWKQFETYAQDFLGIYCEYIDYQRQIKYDHRPSDPDDAFHSLLYCWQAASIFHGKRWQT